MTLAKDETAKEEFEFISSLASWRLGENFALLYGPAPCHFRKFRNSRRVRGPYVANDGFGVSA